MKPNPILDEVWRIKDELAREAGNDVRRLCENTRQWAVNHPHPGPVIRTANDLSRLVADRERLRGEVSSLALNDSPQHSQ